MVNNTTNPHGSYTAAHDCSSLTVCDILTRCQFSRYEYRTLLTPDGRLAQGSMLVENPADPKDRYIVTANYERDDEEWTV